MAAVIAGSYVAGLISWAQVRLVRWVYLTSPTISVRSPYSSPVAGSQLHAKVMLSSLLLRSDASFLSSL